MVWHPLDPLRYAIWNPEDHHGITISDEDRIRLTDSSIPLNERLWSTCHYVLESMNGGKPQEIDIPFVNPSEYGFDISNYVQILVKE
ncbi:DAPG hydrolase family protein [Methanosphaera sp.]